MNKLLLLTLILVVCFSCKQNRTTENDKNQRIKIGVIVPLSGSGAAYGKDALRGIELAVKEINQNTSVKYSLIVEDNQTNSKVAVNAAQKLINIDNVKIIIGPVTSSSTLSVAPICEKNKVICLSPGASNPKISTSGDYIFRNWISDELEGKAMARYIKNSDNFSKVAILYINNDYGIGLKDVFSKEFKKLGGEIILNLGYNQGETNFKIILDKIKNEDIEVVYLPGYYKEMANIIIESKKVNLNLPFRSVVTFEEPKLLKLTGNLANGVIYSTPYYDVNSSNPIIKSFVNRFNKFYSRKPGIFAAHGYDAMQLIANCYNENVDSVKISLYNIKDFNGVSGVTSFDVNGDVIKTVAIKEVINGSFVTIKLLN